MKKCQIQRDIVRQQDRVENAPGVSSAAGCQAYMDHVLTYLISWRCPDVLNLMTFESLTTLGPAGNRPQSLKAFAHSSKRHCQATAACHWPG